MMTGYQASMNKNGNARKVLVAKHEGKKDASTIVSCNSSSLLHDEHGERRGEGVKIISPLQLVLTYRPVALHWRFFYPTKTERILTSLCNP
jgi:hypothetical protein